MICVTQPMLQNKNELNWIPSVTFEEGLCKTIDCIYQMRIYLIMLHQKTAKLL